MGCGGSLLDLLTKITCTMGRGGKNSENNLLFLDAKILSWQGSGEVPGEDSHSHRCTSMILNGK